MQNKRPVFLSLTKVRFPITAYVSFAHRVSGILLLLFIPALMYAFHLSLKSQASFNQLTQYLQYWPIQLFAWAGLSALAYHSFAGMKHLAMDIGIGEDLPSGIRMAWIVIALTVLTSALLAIKLFF